VNDPQPISPFTPEGAHKPQPLRDWIRRRPLFAFFLLTFAFSWLIWLLPILVRITDPVAFRQLNTIGAFGPALAGLLVQSLLHPDRHPAAWQKRVEAFSLAFLAAGALYFICLPYASSQPFAASILGWILRILLFLAAALVISSVLTGHEPLRRMLLPVGLRTHPAWYAAALLVYPVLLLVGLGLSATFGQTIQWSLPEGGGLLLAVRVVTSFVYIFLFGGPLNEEPGWRGFALPRMQRSLSPLAATLILGTAWGVWHFPMHLNGFYPSAGLSSLPTELALRVLSTLLVAFLYTWFFNKTKGNVLVCTLLHASFNTASAFISGSPLTMLLLGVLALVLIFESRQWLKLPPAPDPA